MSVLALIDAHLDQISACAQTISDLHFPAPKIFTNALLQSHDITALIRDTEAHERALFTVTRAAAAASAVPSGAARRRTTVGPATAGFLAAGGVGGAAAAAGGGGGARGAAPRRNAAVAAVLGGDLAERIRRSGSGAAKAGGEVDVLALLEGAEKLCGVYPMAGAASRIVGLRERYARLAESVAYYEARAAEQAVQLSRLRTPGDFEDARDDEDEDEEEQEVEVYTEEDMKREEADIKGLEQRKKTLEERVSAMEKDLSYR